MRDPGNPRKTFETSDAPRQSDQPADPPIDMVAVLGRLVRAFTMVVMVVLLIVGTFFALRVFYQVGHLILNPVTAADSVDAIHQIVDGEKLAFTLMTEQKIEPGKLVSFGALLVLYLIWIWIPMKLIGVTGRLLLAFRADRDAS